jgi:hypothetical protein
MTSFKLVAVVVAGHLATALYFILDRTPGSTAAWAGLPLDDAWIHMVYARSLSLLQGFAYNPGQLETGSTSPLWAVLLVPGSWAARLFSTSVVIPAKLTGIVTAVAAALGAARLVRRLGYGAAAEWAAGLIIALDPALAFAQVSGMEVMLASALALWALDDLLAERYLLAGIWAALAPLARPELGVLTLFVLGFAGWRMHKAQASTRSRWLLFAPTVVLLGAWMLYCQLVSGHPLPSTFYAKFASRQAFFTHNLVLFFTEVLPSWSWFAHGTGFVLWGTGAVVLLRRGGVPAFLALFPLMLIFAVAASQLVKEPSPFYWQRYWLPALPFLLLCLVVGAREVVTWVWAKRRVAWAPLFAVGAAALLLGSLSALPSTLRRSARLYAWNCQNIEELNVAMARWLRDHTLANERIAVTDAGAARYFGERPIFDVLGLNNHRFLHQKTGLAAELSKIRYLASFPALVPFLRDNPAWRPIHRVSTSHLTICNCPQSEIVAFEKIDPR